MLFNTRDALTERATIRPVRRKGGWMKLLGQVLKLGEGHAELLRHGERPWASATFCGSRHTILLAFSGVEGAAAGERLIAALPDYEFEVPGYLVADSAVTQVNHALAPDQKLEVEVELLLLQDL